MDSLDYWFGEPREITSRAKGWLSSWWTWHGAQFRCMLMLGLGATWWRLSSDHTPFLTPARAVSIAVVRRSSSYSTVLFFGATTKKLLSQWPDTVINAKRAWFIIAKVGVVTKISRVLSIQMLQCSPPHHHLSMPMMHAKGNIPFSTFEMRNQTSMHLQLFRHMDQFHLL